MKSLSLFALAALCVVACAPQQKNDEAPLNIVQVPIPATGTVDFDTLFEVQHVVVPELTEATTIKSPYLPYFTDSLVIIFDDVLQRIFVFDMQGKYLHDIGQKGEGQEQFVKLNHVVVANGKVYAFDKEGQKMLTYGVDGQLISVTPSAFNFNSFAKADNGFWLCACTKESNPNGYNLIHADETLQDTIACFFPQHPDFVNVEWGTNFIIHSNEVLFHSPSSNVIYRLKGDEVTPFLTIDLGKNTPNYVYISRLATRTAYTEYMEQNKYYRMFFPHSCGNFITFEYERYVVTDFASPSFAYYNTATGKLVAIPTKAESVGADPLLGKSFGIGETDDCIILCNYIGYDAETQAYIKEKYGIEAQMGSNPAIILAKPKL